MEPSKGQPTTRSDNSAAAAFVATVEPSAGGAQALVAYAVMLPDGGTTSGCVQSAGVIDAESAVNLAAGLLSMASNYAATVITGIPPRNRAAAAEFISAYVKAQSGAMHGGVVDARGSADGN